jgi:hypothetical protein
MKDRSDRSSKQPGSGLPGMQTLERNPQAHARHRRETFWQITFPFLFLLLAFLALVVGVSWAAMNEAPDLRRWADVAVLWQLPLPMFLSLLCLAINIGLVIGLVKLIGLLPGFTYKAHSFALLVQQKIEAISDLLVEPFIRASSLKARLLAGLRAIRKL